MNTTSHQVLLQWTWYYSKMLQSIFAELLELFPNLEAICSQQEQVNHKQKFLREIIFTIHHALGGSGRQSLSRIAAYICEYNTFQISVTRSYRTFEFKEDLKTLYALTGISCKQTSFLFNDTQVTDESFLEIINNMLSSGEVANLYKSDEFEEVITQ